MKTRIKKLFAILLTLTLVCSASSLMSLAVTVEWDSLQIGDTITCPDGEELYFTSVSGLPYFYATFGAYESYNQGGTTMAEVTQGEWLGGLGSSGMMGVAVDTSTSLLESFYGISGVTTWYYVYDDQLGAKVFAGSTAAPSQGGAEEDVDEGSLLNFAENGEDFWKWWRNAARLVRTEKTVTLNVPEEIDNTIVPTFLFTAIKEANANVTLNINGETYTLNANNLPSYYAWASEVNVEVLK